ncbi:MAG: orotidine-5-phosphate decarboxylase [Actinomycetota bacterium]|jgi:orotidine-5'-phosphate decarboxylase
MDNFAKKLESAVTEFGSLCVGIDPSESTLSDWGIPDTAEGARDFGYAIISACEQRVGIIKPQVAFFERFGSSGLFALEEVLAAARESNLLVISDAKRGDIGSTMLGYAQAWFGDDSPLRSDALTLSPYLGPSSLLETIDAARDVQAGVFLLAATSNPEAHELQKSKLGSLTNAGRVLRFARENSHGDVGVVIGATVNLAEFGIESVSEDDVKIPILAPGFGVQGAQLSQVKDLFGRSHKRVIASVSRAISQGGSRAIIKSIEELKAQL